MIDKAIESRSKLLKFDPTSIQDLRVRAKLYNLQGQFALATADSNRAAKLSNQLICRD